MLLIVALILIAFWALGLFAHIGGGLIHVLLVIALVVFIVNMLTNRRSV